MTHIFEPRPSRDRTSSMDSLMVNVSGTPSPTLLYEDDHMIVVADPCETGRRAALYFYTREPLQHTAGPSDLSSPIPPASLSAESHHGSFPRTRLYNPKLSNIDEEKPQSDGCDGSGVDEEMEDTTEMNSSQLALPISDVFTSMTPVTSVLNHNSHIAALPPLFSPSAPVDSKPTISTPTRCKIHFHRTRRHHHKRLPKAIPVPLTIARPREVTIGRAAPPAPTYHSFPPLPLPPPAARTVHSSSKDYEDHRKSKLSRTANETASHWADDEPSIPLNPSIRPASGADASVSLIPLPDPFQKAEEEEKKWSTEKHVHFTDRVYGAIERGDLEESDTENEEDIDEWERSMAEWRSETGGHIHDGMQGPNAEVDIDEEMESEICGSENEDEDVPMLDCWYGRPQLSPRRGLKRRRDSVGAEWDVLGKDEGYESGGENVMDWA